MDPCSQAYANAPCPPPPPPPLHQIPFVPGQLPFTGFELVALVGFAVVCVTIGLLLSWSERAA